MGKDLSKLIVLSGIFQVKGDPEGTFVYPEDGPACSLSGLFEPVAERHVDLALHYFPPSGAFDATKPGAGCCLLGQHCRAGHLQDPGHLFSVSLSGVLERASGGTWRVGTTVLPLSDQMDGHYGRLILFTRGEIREDRGVESLLQEASELSELLSSLRGTLKANP